MYSYTDIAEDKKVVEFTIKELDTMRNGNLLKQIVYLYRN